MSLVCLNSVQLDQNNLDKQSGESQNPNKFSKSFSKFMTLVIHLLCACLLPQVVGVADTTF